MVALSGGPEGETLIRRVARIKVAMEFRLDPTPAGTLLSTETRILATDPWSRRFFAAYWFLIRSSSAAIRREVLRVVAGRAESQARRDAQR